jgi:hypothetical protein
MGPISDDNLEEAEVLWLWCWVGPSLGVTNPVFSSLAEREFTAFLGPIVRKAVGRENPFAKYQ